MRKSWLVALLLLNTAGVAIAQDVRERLFISPMGEPFRRPDGGEDPQDAWFAGADADHDGALTRAEFTVDAMRFFAVLDRGHDGEIDPDDIERYETVIVPEVRVGGGGMMGGGGRMGGHRGGGGRGGRGGHRGGGGGPPPESGGGSAAANAKQGAARFSYFDYPEPIVVADTNFNRGIDAAEFQHAAEQRFAMLDSNHDGTIRKAELPHLSPPLTWGGFGGGFGNGRRGGPGGGGRRLGEPAQPIDLPPPPPSPQ